MADMNLHQLKQQLGNNIWYGENRREREIVQTAVSSLLLPDKNTAWLIDISHWNLPVVMLEYMRDEWGLVGVIIKGCDGTIRSRYFDEHRQTAIDAGLPFGIYDWLYPSKNVSISAQVTAWANQANEIPPKLGVFIDAEKTKYAGVYVYPNASDLRSAHDQLKTKWGTGTTYTSPGYAKSYLKGFDFSREPLWIAHYGVGVPELPAGALTWEFHQYTDNLAGAILDPRPNGNEELDGNVYNGTRQGFFTKYGAGEIPPTGEPIMKFTAVAIGDGTKIRPNHNTVTDFNPVKQFPAGTRFEGDEDWVATTANKDASQYVGDRWLAVKTINGVAVEPCWVAVVHRGVAICALRENPVEPEPTDPDVWEIYKNGVLVHRITGTSEDF